MIFQTILLTLIYGTLILILIFLLLVAHQTYLLTLLSIKQYLKYNIQLQKKY